MLKSSPSQFQSSSRSARLRNGWHLLIKTAINRRILRATMIVGSLTLLARLAFVARDLVVAWRFGRSPLFEAFLLAFVVPYSISNALSMSLTFVFVPGFIKLRESGRHQEAQELYSRLLLWLVLISGAILFLCVITQPLYVHLVAASLSGESWIFMRNLLWLTGPAAFLSGLAIFWQSILTADEKFVISSAVTIFTPSISILLLLLAMNTGVLALSLGLLFGAMIELFILGLALRRRNVPLLPRWRGSASSMRLALPQWTRLLLSMLFINAMAVVDNAMAARLAEPGSVAALNYGKKSVTLPLDLSAIAFVTALYPYFSKMVVTHDWLRLRTIVRQSLALIFAINLPIVFALVIWSKPIVKLLFERGQFTPADTEIVSRVLIYYAFNLPFYVAFLVMIKLLSSMQKTAAAIWFSGAALMLNIVLSYLFSKYMGVPGIGMATSCLYFVLALLLYNHTNGLLNRAAAAEQKRER